MLYLIKTGARPSVRVAEEGAEAGKNEVLVKTQDDLADVPTDVLVALNNRATPNNPIKKFSSRAAGVTRVFQLLPTISAAKGAGKTKGDSNAKGPGRVSPYTGRAIKLTGKAEEAKRHEKSLRTAAFALIKDGMSYESYLKAGGRADFLRHEIKMGRAKVS